MQIPIQGSNNLLENLVRHTIVNSQKPHFNFLEFYLNCTLK